MHVDLLKKQSSVEIARIWVTVKRFSSRNFPGCWCLQGLQTQIKTQFHPKSSTSCGTFQLWRCLGEWPHVTVRCIYTPPGCQSPIGILDLLVGNPTKKTLYLPLAVTGTLGWGVRSQHSKLICNFCNIGMFVIHFGRKIVWVAITRNVITFQTHSKTRAMGQH